MKQLKTYIHTYIGRLCKSLKRTEKNTIMWIKVPMSCNSAEHKTEVMLSVINHMEQTIKINKNE